MLTDGVAVVALVLAFVVPPLGVVLGLVTLVQIRRRRERSWGLLPCCVGLAVSLFLSGGMLLDWVRGDPAVKSLYALDEGTCFNQRFSDLADIQVRTVPCDGPHEGEVFARFSFGSAGDAFPGEERIRTLGHEKCDERQFPYARDLWAFPANVAQMLHFPHAKGWSVGHRKGVCAFENTPDQKLPGYSLRADASTLDEHQLAYLNAENLTNVAYLSFPAKEEVAWDLDGYRQWAQGIADAMRAEEQQLRQHSWAPGVQPRVTAFADDLADARTQWLAAAKAPDPYVFADLWDEGKQVFGGPSAVAVRKALGLAHGDAWRPGGVFSRVSAGG